MFFETRIFEVTCFVRYCKMEQSFFFVFSKVFFRIMYTSFRNIFRKIFRFTLWHPNWRKFPRGPILGYRAITSSHRTKKIYIFRTCFCLSKSKFWGRFFFRLGHSFFPTLRQNYYRCDQNLFCV